jgi:hypothetical protein
MRIELEFVRRTTKRVYFRIKNQWTTKSGFTQFTASNGIQIESICCPEWAAKERILFARGVDEFLDNKIIYCSPFQWTEILEAVLEYNAYDYKKRKRKKKVK